MKYIAVPFLLLANICYFITFLIASFIHYKLEYFVTEFFINYIFSPLEKLFYGKLLPSTNQSIIFKELLSKQENIHRLRDLGF